MSCRSIGLLICMFTAVSLATLYREPDSTTEWSTTESVPEVRRGAGEELGALLEAGGTRLVAQRAVLAAMLPHYSGLLSIPDMGGAVLRRLLAYLYTLRAPRLPPGAATQLLAAAHRLGLPALQADCERQVAEQLSAETAASAAVLAVKLSLTELRDAAINFIKDHFVEVRATKGWADAVEGQPTELLAGRMAKNGAPATTEAETSTSTEAVTTASSQRHSASQTPATAAPPLAACPTAPLDEATVSGLRGLSAESAGSRLLPAARKGAVWELRALLAVGADVGVRDRVGWTALHWAARRGRAEAASCLLAAGAPVDARDRWQATPLNWAAFNGHAAVVRLLLAASADPNAGNYLGMTPLHWAAMFDRADVAAALLEAGADRGARNAEGLTPLDYARSKDNQHIFEMLTQH